MNPVVVLPFQMLAGVNEFKVVARQEGVTNYAGFACAVCKQGSTSPLFVSDESWTFKKQYELSPTVPLPPSTLNVNAIRLKARDGQPEFGVVCSEVKLQLEGKWIRPVSGSVSTVQPGHSGDWRLLDDDSNGGPSHVHTDVTTPGNAIVLHYGGVRADELSIWVRTDVVPNSSTDFMYNVDVEIIGENDRVVWKKRLNPSLYYAAGNQYTLSFQNLPSD